MTNFPETQNFDPKFPHTLRGKFLFLGVFLVAISGAVFWFLPGVFSAGVGQNGVEKRFPNEASVEGVSREKKTSDKVTLENLFPVSGSVPVKRPASGDFLVAGAHASLLLDAQSGTILYHDNGTERRQIASLTKLMTALLVMENGKSLDEIAIIPSEVRGVEGTVVGCPRSGYCNGNRLVPGEKMTVRDLLRATLMNSANDAALSLGVYVSGSQEAFVEKMNARAQALGLRDTHFCTPSGLEPDGVESTCYSTAYDIARIAAKLLPYEDVWKILQSPPMTIASVDGKRTHDILNTDQILGTQNIMGVKTGFTPNAGKSLLAVAHNGEGNHPVVAVLLNDPYRWEDIKTMLTWAYRAYRWE